MATIWDIISMVRAFDLYERERAIKNCFDLISIFRCAHTEQEQIVIPKRLTSEVLAAIQSVRFIAQHIKDSDKDNEVS